MTVCKLCGNKWFVSSPPYSFAPAELSHYCSATGSRVSRYAETPEEHEAGAASASLSSANARAYK